MVKISYMELLLLLERPQPMPSGDGEEIIPQVVNDIQQSPLLDFEQNLVIQAVMARGRYGENKYHTPLRTSNGRDGAGLVDLLQELADGINYYGKFLLEEYGGLENAPADVKAEYLMLMRICARVMDRITRNADTASCGEETIPF